jgi:peptidoglycan/xylan/chitin deacetylase (PgdA/CDA1 family)
MAGLAARGLALAHRCGVLDISQVAWRRRLTVLAYHRIDDPDAAGFLGLRDTVSATPEAFAAQIDAVRRSFDVVSLDDLLAWTAGRGTLPARPLLITFDDGYRDNLIHALPALRRRALPAVLFVATDCIDGRPFYWDVVAHAFAMAAPGGGDLPLLGPRVWNGEGSRRALIGAWIAEAKQRPEADRRRAVDDLATALGVRSDDGALAGLYLRWDELRRLHDAGVAIGAHTMSHPILSRVPAGVAEREIAGGKDRLERELGIPVSAFAYPNGRPQDFDDGHRRILERLGFALAFTLSPGPDGLAAARRRPLAIRRICVGPRDEPARFSAKLAGLARLTSRM